MASRKTKWILGGLAGCLTVVAIGIALAGVGLFSLFGHHAETVTSEVEAVLGPELPEGYTINYGSTPSQYVGSELSGGGMLAIIHQRKQITVSVQRRDRHEFLELLRETGFTEDEVMEKLHFKYDESMITRHPLTLNGENYPAFCTNVEITGIQINYGNAELLYPDDTTIRLMINGTAVSNHSCEDLLDELSDVILKTKLIRNLKFPPRVEEDRPS